MQHSTIPNERGRCIHYTSRVNIKLFLQAIIFTINYNYFILNLKFFNVISYNQQILKNSNF